MIFWGGVGMVGKENHLPRSYSHLLLVILAYFKTSLIAMFIPNTIY